MGLQYFSLFLKNVEPDVHFFLCAPGHPLLKQVSIHLVLPKEKTNQKKKGQKAPRAISHRCSAEQRCGLMNVYGLRLRCLSITTNELGFIDFLLLDKRMNATCLYDLHSEKSFILI
jgi:hypothetical protein